MKLTVRKDNPFTTGYINEFSDDSALLLRTQIAYSPSPNDQFILLEDGLDLSDISFVGYRNSKFWWIIADVNNITNPFELVEFIGKTLIVPDLNKILATAL